MTTLLHKVLQDINPQFSHQIYNRISAAIPWKDNISKQYLLDALATLIVIKYRDKSQTIIPHNAHNKYLSSHCTRLLTSGPLRLSTIIHILVSIVDNLLPLINQLPPLPPLLLPITDAYFKMPDSILSYELSPLPPVSPDYIDEYMDQGKLITATQIHELQTSLSDKLENPNQLLAINHIIASILLPPTPCDKSLDIQAENEILSINEVMALQSKTIIKHQLAYDTNKYCGPDYIDPKKLGTYSAYKTLIWITDREKDGKYWYELKESSSIYNIDAPFPTNPFNNNAP